MKKNFLLFLIIHSAASAQPPGEWMWIHGTNVAWSPGNYGIQGVPSPTNIPPAIYEGCEWTDLNGNFWLFGGVSSGGSLADLWKYDPAINQWTWMKGPGTTPYPGNYGVQGVPSPTNNPPGRAWGTPSWIDLQGNLWFGFGADNTPQVFSDLWKYDISTNEWTWVKGPNIPNVIGTYGIQGIPDPANNPGARYETAAAWTDSNGDLWLFGGSSDSSSLWFDGYNDLWKFNIATNTWTWMKGSNIVNAPAFYGLQNVENPMNSPGERMSYAHWKGNDGTLWFFGGWNNTGFYNDLWRFDIATNNWTWMNGNYLPDDSGRYGTKCVMTSSNIPTGVAESRAAWKDQNGNFWFLGGGKAAVYGWNSMWMYCVATNQWTWINGDTIVSPPGNWGTINVPSPANKLSGRLGSLSWIDGSGHLYLFGGFSSPPGAPMNDLWRYTFDPDCYPCQVQQLLTTATQDSSICIGNCTDISVTTQGGDQPYSYSWTPNIGMGAGPHQVCPNITTTYSVLVTDSSGNTTADSVTITVNPLPPILASSDTTISAGNSVILTATGGGTYFWSSGQTSSSITVSPTVDTEYCVTVTNANQCTDTVCVKVFVTDAIPCPTNENLEVPNAFSPNNDGQNDVFCLEGWNVCIKDFVVYIYDRWGEEVYQSTNPEFCWDGIYKGKQMDAAVFVYYIEAELTTSEEVIRKGNISLIR